MLIVVGLAVCLIGLAPATWTVVRNPGFLSPIHLMPASAGLLLGLPPLVYFAITGEPLAATMSGEVGGSVTVLVAASIALFVVVCAVTALAFGTFRRMLTPLGDLMRRLRRVGLARVAAVAAFVWSVRLVAAGRYGWFYAGSVGPETVPYFFYVLDQVAQFLGVAVVVWAAWSVADARSRTTRWAGVLFLLLEVPFVFTQGRREMFFYAVLVGAVFLYARRRFSGRQAVRAMVFLAGLVMVAFPLYQGTRVVRAMNPGAGGQPLGPSEYIENLGTATQMRNLDEAYLANLQHRLSVYYRWQAELATMQRSAGTMRGDLLLSGIQYSVPRFLLENKGRMDWGEEAIREHYGAPLSDRPNSLMAAGFADFGLAGVAAYGFFFVALLFFGELFAVRVMAASPFLGAAIGGNLVLLALRTEISMVGVFATIREMVVVGTLAILCSIVVKDYERVVFRGSPT